VEEITGDWRKLHNKELYGSCFLPYIISMIKQEGGMGGPCDSMEKERCMQGFGGETWR
jgi:hypothetical protein